MRLADTTAPARASGPARRTAMAEESTARTVRRAHQERTGGPIPRNARETAGQSPEASSVFAAAVASFEAGRHAVARLREDLEFEDWPAPKRIAPHAAALAVTAYRDGVEAGTGKLLLLHDPQGQDGWSGTFRMVCQVHADVEAEMAADPLLGEVGWSWLTDALDLHAPGYESASGTVTRVITEGYGAKEGEPASTALELRASWCPADDEIDGAVMAWCDLLAAAAGLPATGTLALSPHGRGANGPGSHGQGPGGRRRR